MMTRQTFAAGDTVRLAHLEAVARMNTELTALRARVEALEGAVQKAADTFQHYAELHAAKPDAAKAARNYDLEREMRQALKGTPDAS
jgi:hypothetical protein